MKKIASLAACFLVVASCNQDGRSADYAKLDKRQKIQLMLDKTGAMKIGLQMGTSIFNQILLVWQARSVDTRDTAVAMFKQEFLKSLEAEIQKPDGLKDKIVELYDRNFDDGELADLLEFYDTPTGRKLLAKTPELVKESMAMGQSWGTQYGKEVADRVIARINSRGFSLPPI
jgi:uncharacterized protein